MSSLLDNLLWMLGKIEDQKRLNPRFVVLPIPPSKLNIGMLKFASPCFAGNSPPWNTSPFGLHQHQTVCHFSLAFDFISTSFSTPFWLYPFFRASQSPSEQPLVLLEDLSCPLTTCLCCFYFSVMSIWSFLTAIYSSSSPPQLHFSLSLLPNLCKTFVFTCISAFSFSSVSVSCPYTIFRAMLTFTW